MTALGLTWLLVNFVGGGTSGPIARGTREDGYR